MADLYSVRQYRPAYVSGFTNSVVHNILYDEITKVPFCENFKRKNFLHFTVKEYWQGELIIVAHYIGGEHWVVGFACKEDSKLRKDWRYNEERTQV